MSVISFFQSSWAFREHTKNAQVFIQICQLRGIQFPLKGEDHRDFLENLEAFTKTLQTSPEMTKVDYNDKWMLKGFYINLEQEAEIDLAAIAKPYATT